MANRKRTITLRVPVTEAERALIEQKMELLPTANFAAYARKVLISLFFLSCNFCLLNSFFVLFCNCLISSSIFFIFLVLSFKF